MFLSSLFSLSSPIFPSTATTLSPITGDTRGLVAGSRKKSERLQLVLAKPVYTDGGKLHYFCEGRGGGGEGGGLAEFAEVVYKLKEGRGWRTLGQNTSSVLHIIRLSTNTTLKPFNTSSIPLFLHFHQFKNFPRNITYAFWKRVVTFS